VPAGLLAGARRLVSRPTAVFSSWHGRWSDSPRALSQELLRREAPLRQVWVLAEGAPGPPPAVERVAPDSPRSSPRWRTPPG
jgi:CDP-glycerol glycerophosphotransferase